MKIALVYDRVNKIGGAERVLLALHEIWPEAPLFTAVYNPESATWADVFRVRPSFLNLIPFARTNHELLALLTPLAFETFDFAGYDVVLSVTSSDAKSVITRPGTLHICYCLTPNRYLWSGFGTYSRARDRGLFGNIAPRVLRRLAPALRRWDMISCQRPDIYIAISRTVKARIEKYYHRHVGAVIYPPVDTSFYIKQPGKDKIPPRNGYFLTVSRMVGYKRLDILIDAFTRLGWPLVIIGSGRERNLLISRAGKNITFIDGNLTDTELAGYYKNCRGFVYAGDEDFGLVAVEAQASGVPVFTYRRSGMAEAVIEGKTGDFFDRQTAESLIGLMTSIRNKTYNPADCRQSALRFDKEIFRKNIFDFVNQEAHNREV
jgi:glycosyltransferase involved in cell wall biosynthesis